MPTLSPWTLRPVRVPFLNHHDQVLTKVALLHRPSFFREVRMPKFVHYES